MRTRFLPLYWRHQHSGLVIYVPDCPIQNILEVRPNPQARLSDVSRSLCTYFARTYDG
jgi:hypothetical protein